MKRIPSEMVPQADKFEKLFDVLEEIRGGTFDAAQLARACRLPSARQGGYYRLALKSIDLVREEGGKWLPTDLGTAIADTENHHHKITFMKAIVRLNPAVALVHGAIRDSGRNGIDVRLLNQTMLEAAELSPTTAQRRVGTIIRWLTYLGMIKRKGSRYTLAETS